MNLKLKLRNDAMMDLLLECINVRYAYERRAFKHVEPEGGHLTDKDIDALERAVKDSFTTFLYEQFEVGEE